MPAKKKVAKGKQKKPYDKLKAPFSWDKLDGLLAYKASLATCADILETCPASIKNHIKECYDLTFTEYADRKLSRTKVKLVQKAIEQALGGSNTMLIFCLKNICKWADIPEPEQSQTEDLEFLD